MSNQNIFPLFGNEIRVEEYCAINLSEQNPNLEYTRTSDPQYLNQFIQKKIASNNVKYGIGGYNEKRGTYSSGTQFNPPGKNRCIHLGIDIWTGALTQIYAPIDGEVHSFANNDLPYDYGGTLILKHDFQGQVFHTLYGHISLEPLAEHYPGKKIKAGEPICQLGDWNENGGWPPHLHFQQINDMQGKLGDYFGACDPSETDFYLNNCPDPMRWIGIEHV